MIAEQQVLSKARANQPLPIKEQMRIASEEVRRHSENHSARTPSNCTRDIER